MTKIKQRYLAYKTAERNFNKRKVALKEEFSSEMHKAAKVKDIERFKVLGDEMVRILGDEYSVIAIQIDVWYGLNVT